jgi:hypothetical protein
MTKKELADKVREAARDIASRADKPETDNPMAFKYSEMLYKFPKLEETLIRLLSDDFTTFVEDIEWVAPRPTTFKIVLKNQNNFHLIWNGDEFTARVAGTQYNLASLGDEQRAIKAIQELLITGPINPDKGAATPSQNLTPAEETPEETTVETPPEI